MRQFNRILIVNPFGIGDVLFTTPFIAALKERIPGVSISYVGNARTAPFLRNDPRIDKVFSYERDDFVAVYRRSPWQFILKWKQLVADIRAGQFDLAFDLSLGSPLGLALVLAGVPERVGFNYKGRGRWLTRSFPLQRYEKCHIVDHHFELLRLMGIEAEPGKMRFYLQQKDKEWADNFLEKEHLTTSNIIGMFPGGGASWGAGARFRHWDIAKYAKLADKIIEKASCSLILFGDKTDRDLCEDIAARMSRKPVIVAGWTSLGEAAALMERCRLLVMNDSGAMHVAAALGVRTVVIFGPVDEKVYGPFPVHEQIIVSKPIPCRPCYRNFRMSDCRHLSCLKQLTVDEVYSTLEEFL
jgi:lipopolysaccharide heptosyltransferase II